MRVEIIITDGPAQGQQFVFEQPDRFVFGRAIDSRVCIPNDPYVSRQHFLLEISPPDCKVTDLNSKNGLVVNGVRYGGRKSSEPGIRQAPDGENAARLNDGDEVMVGDTRMRVKISGQPQPGVQERLALESESPPQPITPMGLLHKLLKDAAGKKSEPDIPTIKGYRIEKMLNRGGMGMVYKAVEAKTGQTVAIKIMFPHMAADPENIATFQREIDVTRQLNHPHIVQLLNHGKTEKTFYFVMEFVDGMNLYEFLQSRGGQLSVHDAAPLMLQMLDGLAFAHQATITAAIAGGQTKTFTGVVHRDLKPQNILLGRRGEEWIPKISDFGISKSFEAAGLTNITKPGSVLGTPMYWPREQITHYKYLNPATDVFSLATVFYEMLTGKWIREGFDALFEKCKQQKRPATIAEYMQIIMGNPAIPIQQRNPNIPAPIAQVIDRALKEAEVPYDEVKMRDALAELRYADAAVFQKALLDAFESAGFTPHANQPRIPTPALPHRAAVVNGEIFYSLMPPVSTQDVALLVLDLKESSEYLHEVGDTYFSNLIGNIYKIARSHPSASDLNFLKSTGDGFLAVFHSTSAALSLAAAFLHHPALPSKTHLRMAIHWGSVKTGPEGDVLGVEVHKVFRIENVQQQDQVDKNNPFPAADRILITSQALMSLNAVEQSRFRYAGTFQIKGFDEFCPLWIFQE